MYLHYNSQQQNNDTFLEDVILKSCVEWLRELCISNCHSAMMKGFQGKFPNVKKVDLRYGQLSIEMSAFDKRFPKIVQLLVSAEFSPEFIMKHFPTLTVLQLNIPIESSTLSTENVMKAVSLNPQLRVLKLESNDSNMQLNTRFLDFISFKLPKLETFHSLEIM